MTKELRKKFYEKRKKKKKLFVEMGDVCCWLRIIIIAKQTCLVFAFAFVVPSQNTTDVVIVIRLVYIEKNLILSSNLTSTTNYNIQFNQPLDIDNKKSFNMYVHHFIEGLSIYFSKT